MDRLLTQKPRLADPTRTDIPEIQTDPRENELLVTIGKYLSLPAYAGLAMTMGVVDLMKYLQRQMYRPGVEYHPIENLGLAGFADVGGIPGAPKGGGIAQIKAFHGGAKFKGPQRFSD